MRRRLVEKNALFYLFPLYSIRNLLGEGYFILLLSLFVLPICPIGFPQQLISFPIIGIQARKIPIISGIYKCFLSQLLSKPLFQLSVLLIILIGLGLHKRIGRDIPLGLWICRMGGECLSFENLLENHKLSHSPFGGESQRVLTAGYVRGGFEYQ